MGLILTLLGIGFLLIIVDIFLLTGTIKVAMAGAMVLVIAVYLTYTYHGYYYGNIVLLGSGIGTLFLTVIGLRYLSNNDVGLKEQVEGRVNLIDRKFINEGDEGVAQGDLKLGGRAIFADLLQEVESTGEFIENGQKIVVKKIVGNKIFVEAIDKWTPKVDLAD